MGSVVRYSPGRDGDTKLWMKKEDRLNG